MRSGNGIAAGGSRFGTTIRANRRLIACAVTPMDDRAVPSPANGIRYAFDGVPAAGAVRPVAPGIWWHRMPLPFKLDHINLWLIEDGDGWTAVDCGIKTDAVTTAWESLFAGAMGGRPISRLIVTHFHPDHVGLAGWLAERWGAPLWMALGEWAYGRMLSLDTGHAVIATLRAFYRACGFPEERLALVDARRNRYAGQIAPIPGRFRRLHDGEEFTIGGRVWRVIVGRGHSPEHACLWCPDLGVLISGDQILPRITTNISVWPQEPEANPLRLYLDSLSRFDPLPADTLVLPSHDAPFRGLKARLRALAHHHDARLAETVAVCGVPSTGHEVLRALFQRPLDNHQLFFAIGESLAHLHFLEAEGRLARTTGADGVHRFQAIDRAARLP